MELEDVFLTEPRIDRGGAKGDLCIKAPKRTARDANHGEPSDPNPVSTTVECTSRAAHASDDTAQG